MSYTELEHGYQGLKKARPAFYFGDSSVRPVKHRVSYHFFFSTLLTEAFSDYQSMLSLYLASQSLSMMLYCSLKETSSSSPISLFPPVFKNP